MTGYQLEELKDSHVFVEQALVGCSTLERALRPLIHDDSQSDLGLALGLVNLEGPGREGSFGELWRRLNSKGKLEVLRDLDRIVETTATEVSNFIRSINISGKTVTCAWSEVPLLAIDGFFRPEGTDDLHVRPDLVVWRQGGDIDVLDIKVGATEPPDWVRHVDSRQVAEYVDGVRQRVDSDRRVRGFILRVGRGSGKNRFRLEHVGTHSE